MGTETRYLGDNARILLSAKHPDTGAVFDPTGCVLLFTVKRSVDDDDDEAFIQKLSTIGGITILNAGTGSIAVDLVPSDWAELNYGQNYVYDLQAQVTATGAVYTVASGLLVPTAAVTKETTLSIPTSTTNPGVAYTWENIPDRPAELQVDPGSPGGVATLGDDGKLKADQIPAISINDTFIVSSQAAMLAVDAQKGDIAIRTDTALTYILQGDDPSMLANWAQMRTSGGDLQIANNLSDLANAATARINLGVTATGADTTYLFRANNLSDLTNPATARSNLGLGNVDNTSDVNKPISTATQAALDLKAPLASPAFTGTPTAPTALAATANTQLATTAFVATAIANLINSAPGALDTLKELADALGDDANFAATMTTALATKAAKAANLSDLADAATARVNLGLGNVENTALSTWAGTTNITTLGTIGTGVWNATAIADGKIASALTGKTYNGLTVTTTTGTFTLANGKTLTTSNSLTLAGTDGTTMTFPGTTATIARTDAGQTFTGSNVIGGMTLNSNAITSINSLSSAASQAISLNPANSQVTITHTSDPALVLVNGSTNAGAMDASSTTQVNILALQTGSAVDIYAGGNNPTNKIARFNASGLQVQSTTASTSTTSGSFVNPGGFGNGGDAYIGGKLYVSTTGSRTSGISLNGSTNTRTLLLDSTGRFRFDVNQAGVAGALWLDTQDNSQSNTFAFATTGTPRFTISQNSSSANVILQTSAAGGVSARGIQFSPNDGSGNNITALDVQYATVTFGVSITMPNNIGIAFKDSAGTATNCLALLSDNTCLVGTQSSTASNGHLLFYVKGTEAGRFSPTSLDFKVNSTTASTSTTSGSIVTGGGIGAGGDVNAPNFIGTLRASTSKRTVYYDGSTNVYMGDIDNIGAQVIIRANGSAVATLGSTEAILAKLLRLQTVTEYTDNTAALGAGLVAGNVYRTGDALKVVH